MQGFKTVINTESEGLMSVNIYNGRVDNGELLNLNCGAGHTKENWCLFFPFW